MLIPVQLGESRDFVGWEVGRPGAPDIQKTELRNGAIIATILPPAVDGGMGEFAA